jgi:hypothetical protein
MSENLRTTWWGIFGAPLQRHVLRVHAADYLTSRFSFVKWAGLGTWGRLSGGKKRKGVKKWGMAGKCKLRGGGEGSDCTCECHVQARCEGMQWWG